MSLLVRVLNELKQNGYVIRCTSVIKKQSEQLSARYSPVLDKRYKKLKKVFKKRGIDFEPAEKRFHQLKNTVVSSLSDYLKQPEKPKSTPRKKKKAS